MKEKKNNTNSKYVIGTHQILVFQEYLATVDEEEIKRVGIDLFTLNATFLCMSPVKHGDGGFDN